MPHEEIGWHPVYPSVEGDVAGLFGERERIVPFHWHGDSFSIPEGSVTLAGSDACRSQAFLYDDHVLGLQFHPEASHETVDLMLDHAVLTPGPFVQTDAQIRAGDPTTLSPVLDRVMCRLLKTGVQASN